MDLDRELQKRLNAALPKDAHFRVHRVSAPPTACPPLFSTPPNEKKPEPTECESHFLSVSIAHEEEGEGQQQLVQVFAVEVLVYITATLTTIFVSKADSTGYLHLLGLPKGGPSPIRTIISNFLELLVQQKRRKDARLLLSLFARSQNQYLFPGSIENSHKHVLDDRGLIKWWCRIFDSILREYPTSPTPPKQLAPEDEREEYVARGYLVVPGSDAYETRAFFPKSVPTTAAAAAQNPPRWVAADPLRSLGKSPTLPERCLIPRFPDDPKARFALDLDDELPENGPQPQDSPAKNPHPGRWRSVRSLEQFWELMAFRQECAAGRLVGFLWAVFEPVELVGRPFEAHPEKDVPEEENGKLAEPETETETKLDSEAPCGSKALDHQPSDDQLLPTTQPKPIAGVQILSDEAVANIEAAPADVSAEPEHVSPLPQAVSTPQISQPLSLRLSMESYNDVTEGLLTYDYADISLAQDSTKKFLAAALAAAAQKESAAAGDWGFEVIGSNNEYGSSSTSTAANAASTSNTTLTNGNVNVSVSAPENQNPQSNENGNGVSLLGAGFVRKKQKSSVTKKRDVEDAGLDETKPGAEDPEVKKGSDNAPEAVNGNGNDAQAVAAVNVLTAGLVRKKPKVNSNSPPPSN